MPLSFQKPYIWPCPIESDFNFVWISIKLEDKHKSNKFLDIICINLAKSDYSPFELCALECPKSPCLILIIVSAFSNEKYFDAFICGLSGEQLLPFGLLVCIWQMTD